MTETLIHLTGELVDLRTEPADTLGRLFEEIDTRTAELRSDKRELSDELARRLDIEGRRSIDIDGWRFEVNAPTERQIDVPELQGVLSALVAEGTISQAKADRVIVWEPRVAWSELKPLTTDPRCQARVNHAITNAPAPRYGKAKRHG
jgi:hypothetical protein